MTTANIITIAMALSAWLVAIVLAWGARGNEAKRGREDAAAALVVANAASEKAGRAHIDLGHVERKLTERIHRIENVCTHRHAQIDTERHYTPHGGHLVPNPDPDPEEKP